MKVKETIHKNSFFIEVKQISNHLGVLVSNCFAGVQMVLVNSVCIWGQSPKIFFNKEGVCEPFFDLISRSIPNSSHRADLDELNPRSAAVT